MKQLFLTFALILAPAPLLAQTGGTVIVTVTDEQGAVVPGAALTAQGVDAKLTSTTNEGGQYRFPELAPGAYTIRVELGNFAPIESVVVVAVGRTVELPVTLKVARGNEAITVVGTAPIIDPTITGTATNFSSNELTRVPTSRDPWALLRTVPGVLLDQVNVGGNETGQQALVLGKGSRQQDTTWTLDGVEITDVGAAGQSPVYFDFDSFDEIQVSTAGNDIRARTGGVGINLVTKRGGNQFHGSARGYFSDDSMQGTNIPVELTTLATPVTHATSDHAVQTVDYGYELGGPIIPNRAWFYAAMATQDIRTYRRSTSAIDRTKIQSPQIKVNWQATSKDMLNFLFFNGTKIKDGRANNTSSSGNPTQFEDYAATQHQDNAYADSPLHGLWKIGDDRVLNSKIFLSAKYAYFNTGFLLTPEGGMDAQAWRNLNAPTKSWGSTNQTLNIRPQHSVTADANELVSLLGLTHNVKYGTGYRHVLNEMQVEWPGNGIVAVEQTGVTPATSNRAVVFRQSKGANVVKYYDFYVGDSVTLKRLTIDGAVRYDRQWGEALPATTDASKGFPALIPGAVFPGLKLPFTWKTYSPRVGVAYQLNQKTVAKASYSRFAAQLSSGTVGTLNVSTAASPGNVTYVWNDANADHLAQASEVDTTQQIGTAGGGFSVADPTALAASTNQLTVLKPPRTGSLVVGIERELFADMSVSFDYTYNRTTDLFGNLAGTITPRVGVPLSAYGPGPTLIGNLPDGVAYSVNTFIPAGVTAGNVTKTIPGYYTDDHGLELNVIKRLSHRWMGRLTLAYNNAREHFPLVEGRYNTNGNPTGTPSEPLIDGGQFAPTPASSGGLFLNAKWQFNINGAYELPFGFEAAVNTFGRQGYPFPVYRGSITLGADASQRVLVVPTIDRYRLGDVWLTDFRLAKTIKVGSRVGPPITAKLIADAFNVLNSNTDLIRNPDIGSASYYTLSRNVNPRILRVGLTLGF